MTVILSDICQKLLLTDKSLPSFIFLRKHNLMLVKAIVNRLHFLTGVNHRLGLYRNTNIYVYFFFLTCQCIPLDLHNSKSGAMSGQSISYAGLIYCLHIPVLGAADNPDESEDSAGNSAVHGD